MKRFFLSLCAVALLAGCSDDDTKEGGAAPEVGKAQFAAAVDDFVPETRAMVEGGVTTWQTGDRIGITGLIDGTPYIKNVPYEFTEITTFGYLRAVDDAILWNEAVVGERSFFASWPWKESDDGFEQMDRAEFGWSVPALQHITRGVNDARPALIGEGRTDARTGHPVALRFRSLFSVLNLRFEPFAETAVARIILEPAPEAVCEGYLAGEGSVASTGRLTLGEHGQRIEVVSEDGLDIAAGASVQIPVGRFSIEGGLKFTVTTTDDRTFSYTAFADERWCSYVTDEAGEFRKAKFICMTIPLEVVSDETTEVYFEDDFDWIANSTRWKNNNTGGGWPTVTTASPTGKANYFTLDLLKGTETDREDGFVRKGYVQSEQRTSVQARWEGYVCLGTTSAQGALITPPLEAVGDTPTDLLVSFYGATYASESLQADGKPLTIKVLGAGTIGEEDATETEVEITNYYSWRKYWIIVRGATSATQIQFGKDVKQPVGRVLVDNILIGKAVKGAVAGSREVSVVYEPWIRVLEGEQGVAVENAVGAEAQCIVQSNQPWSASTDADWVMVSPTVEYNGTGIAYAVRVTSRTLNETGADRTAEVVFTAGDLSCSVQFTQTGEMPEVVYYEDDFAWSEGTSTASKNAPYGTTGGLFTNFPDVAAGAAIGDNGAVIGSWLDEWKALGYTGARVYAKNGCLTLGIQGNPGTLTTPALSRIGASPTDIVVEFDILEYKNANEKGKTVFSVAGAGEIRSLTGNYTGVAGDTYTGLSADKSSYNFYCGDYKGWTAGAKWHHITVQIAGATEETKLTFAGKEGNCRFWIDNLEVTPQK